MTNPADPDTIALLSAQFATLKSRQATLELARITLRRGEELLPSGGISKEELDQRNNTLKVAIEQEKQAWADVQATRAVLGLAPDYTVTGIKLKLIPAGQFLMGSSPGDKDAEDDEKPWHWVRITQPFYLGVTEVTRGQFRRFVDDAGYQTEAEKDGKGGWGWSEETKKFEQNPRYAWQNPGFEQTDEHPVVNVSWNDAQAFIAWLSRKEGLSYRLPTEAEWEYACRAGTKTQYFFGDDPEGLAAVGNVADGMAKEKYPDWTRAIAARDGYIYTAPVGRFRPNPWGLFDTHGNVEEWCADWYDRGYYKQSPVDDPPGRPDGTLLRVRRGGCWNDNHRGVRAASRLGYIAGDRSIDLGFRLARSQSGR
jgi:formylglycine-generating enzyme required for sulfatase activity